LAYHIRDKNGLDIIYSDTGIESDSHILLATAGSVYVIDWTFTMRLSEGDYTISSMASEPIDLNLGNVEVIDFIPLSVRFSVGMGEHLPVYSAVYWGNELSVQEVKGEK
jgi:lipopolysaccharide transport system ATP-binding protein